MDGGVFYHIFPSLISVKLSYTTALLFARCWHYNVDSFSELISLNSMHGSFCILQTALYLAPMDKHLSSVPTVLYIITLIVTYVLLF